MATDLTNAQQEALEKAERFQEAQAKFWNPIIGIGLFAFGIYMYMKLKNIEDNGGSTSLHWFFYYAYKLGGKWLVSGIICFIGMGLTIFGIKNLLKKK